ncbi:MAG: DNA phosphorothioation system sulfurtransferase DndC [Chloroflexi bacterium]|nr:MAG: DNA phosphorothioation system sulfurtransferase DndC [Chloroflexota bacterium]RLC86282.1 MAG: DNA phosphorothioation system sulfurtransferase DndC [Chloroflexota bacterium]
MSTLESTKRASIFDRCSIDDIYEEIRKVYQSYPYPWVIGYSGGKDSTTALQLVWYALAELPPEQRRKRVYVISTDTLVETPVIMDYIDETLQRIEEHAAESKMPFTTQKLAPVLDDTFWVNLIGRGYPAPNRLFRWCTERLKINPSNRFILSKVAEHGEVILVLGIRRGESATRDQVINMHRFRGHLLARHGQLAGAWVYMPIEHFSTDDVWKYLLQVPSPWGGDNRSLASLYQSANDGECPMVVDDTTPPCGNSRFGCWTCTVVARDRSMEAMIDSGEEWMIPLLEFRDWLASTQDPAVKPQQREFKGRNGRVRITDKGLLWRTFTAETSREALRRLLQTQVQVQQYDPSLVLISKDELKEIRRLWLTERQDWEDWLPKIHSQVTGESIGWDVNDTNTPGRLELELLQEIALRQNVPVQLVQKLIDTEWQYYGMHRRGLIHKTIERVLNEDWRTLEEIQAEVKLRQQQASGPMEIA